MCYWPQATDQLDAALSKANQCSVTYTKCAKKSCRNVPTVPLFVREVRAFPIRIRFDLSAVCYMFGNAFFFFENFREN